MGLFGDFLSDILDDEETKKKKKKLSSKKDEEDLDDIKLDDWEEELVSKGEQDPWNFEEEFLEDDDYFYDDDENEDK